MHVEARVQHLVSSVMFHLIFVVKVFLALELTVLLDLLAREPPVPTLPVLQLQVCATTPKCFTQVWDSTQVHMLA